MRHRPLLRSLVAAIVAGGCASSGASTAGTGLSFEQALTGDSSIFEPARGYRALAEPEWARVATGRAMPDLVGSRWRLAPDCVIHLAGDIDALAASEGATHPVRQLGTEGCRGHPGFWQQAGDRVFWWTGLGGGWSAEYHAQVTSDSSLGVKRYPLRRTGERAWRAVRDSVVAFTAVREREAIASRASYELTRALRAVGETDWATRPGAGTARSVAGTRWRDANGCVLTFGTTILARATRTQRLTRQLQSASCGGLRGSWQQVGKRVFWRVNLDSLHALEIYADLANADTLLRAREYDLVRATTREPFQGTWDPARSRTLVRVRR